MASWNRAVAGAGLVRAGGRHRPRRRETSVAGVGVCGAEVFDDFIGLAFQRGIGATRPDVGTITSHFGYQASEP